MKLLLTALLASSMLVAGAQNKDKMKNDETDSLAIRRVLEENYFKGIYEGDIDVLESIYLPGSLVVGDIKGVPYFKTIAEYLDGVKNRQSVKDSGKPFKGEILSVDVVNSIAVAKLHVKMYDFNYDEFLSFHKIDGHWLIVNKMLTDLNQ